MRWTKREEKVAAWLRKLPPRMAVHDFGCGATAPLRGQVGKRKYLGVDLPGSQANVKLDIEKDLHKFNPPGNRNARIAIAVGLLEYLNDVEGFIRWLSQYYDSVVCTYVCNDGEPRLDIWKNSYTKVGLRSLLLKYFRGVEVKPDIYSAGSQVAFLCSRARRPSAPVWTTIAEEGRINYGNDIIETAISSIIPELRAKCRVLPLWKLGNFARPVNQPFVFVPGSTSLGIQALVDWVGDARIPAYVLGGSAQGATPQQLKFWKTRSRTVFARDPHTSSVLGSKLVGCPTMFCPSLGQDSTAGTRILFSVSRVPIPAEFWASRSFADWTLVLHEQQDAKVVPQSAKFGEVLKLWEMSPVRALRLYQTAGAVVAGRLHAYLPALGRAPVWFYGDATDTRTTILPYMGLRIHTPSELMKVDPYSLKIQTPERKQELAEEFKRAAQTIRSHLK